MLAAADSAGPKPCHGFYCHDRLKNRREVDHFLAWSRWPNDAIENLVIADACNGAKSDYMAATKYAVRWRLHVHTRADELAHIADTYRWPTEPGRTLGLVRSAYGHIAEGTPLWLEGKTFEFIGDRADESLAWVWA